MREIQGDARTVKELLKGKKYAIDYYQREYKWGRKQIQELINDLTSRFLNDYEEEHPRDQVSEYGHYFLGPIIISNKDNMDYLVDGQQRLTSLTLLLIYLRNLQRERSDQVVTEGYLALVHLVLSLFFNHGFTCLFAGKSIRPQFCKIDFTEGFFN